MTPTKQRWPRAIGITVARELCAALEPVCVRLVVAGSLRRRKPDIGDVEIVYIGRVETRPVAGDMFAQNPTNLADVVIAALESRGILARRLNINGSEMYGPKNKLMLHVATGLPVDLFATVENSWWNYLVCRTGPADSNTRIASAARLLGYQWNPYGRGFTHIETGNITQMESEQAVFSFVGLPYLEPSHRASNDASEQPRVGK